MSSFRQTFLELNIEGFGFSNGFKCSDVQKFEIINNLSNKICELGSHQYDNIWKHKIIPIEIIRNDSDRFVDLIIYRNHYVLI